MATKKLEHLKIKEKDTDTGQKTIYIKAPKTFDVTEIEITGNLLLAKGIASAFGKWTETTRVYKRIQ